MVMMVFMFLLIFLSGVIYLIDIMLGWMKVLVYINLLIYVVDGVRYFFVGVNVVKFLFVVDLGVLIVLVVFLVGLVMVEFERVMIG